MNDTLAQEIGKELFNARVRAGITQQELASKINTKQPIISRAESGRYLPTMTLLKRIADAYNAKLLPPTFKFIKKLNEVK